VGLFKPYEQKAASSDAAAPTNGDAKAGQAKKAAAGQVATAQAEAPAGPAKKKVPTPKRRQAQQARVQLLHPELDPKTAKAADREAKMKAREEALRKHEENPSRVLLRDYLDSRRTFCEWTMPVIMLCLVGSLAVQYVAVSQVVVMQVLAYVTWAIMLAIAIDVFRLWRGFKKLHAERYPNAATKGLLGYMVNRAINIRRIRQPQPRVKVGQAV
jgi:hypothetical protein